MAAINITKTAGGSCFVVGSATIGYGFYPRLSFKSNEVDFTLLDGFGRIIISATATDYTIGGETASDGEDCADKLVSYGVV